MSTPAETPHERWICSIAVYLFEFPCWTIDMSQATLFHNPLIRWGMPVTGAAVAIGIAFFILDDRTVQLAIVGVAALHLLVTPQILKRAAREA